MGYDIGSGVSFESVYFDFFSTYVGSSVIGSCTSKGFDVITHKLPILVFTKNKIATLFLLIFFYYSNEMKAILSIDFSSELILSDIV